MTLPSDREIVVTRRLHAPRELVFRAYTDPQMIPHWWGPAQYTTIVEKMDVRPGGVWGYLQKDAGGNEFAFNGEYLEVVPPSKLVSTFEFEPMAGHGSIDTATFENDNGGTLLTMHSPFQSVEDRDGMLGSGMEDGLRETLDRLEAVVATMAR